MQRSQNKQSDSTCFQTKVSFLSFAVSYWTRILEKMVERGDDPVEAVKATEKFPDSFVKKMVTLSEKARPQ